MELFVRLENIRVPDALSDGLCLAGNLYITNDPNIATRIAEPIREIAGSGVCDELRESVFVYARTPKQDQMWNLKVVAKNGLTLAALLGHCLWLLKDNSLNADYAWAWHHYRALGTTLAHTNRHLTYWLNSRTRYGPTEVTRKELESARDLMNQHLRIGGQPLAQFDLAAPHPDQSTPQKDSSRLERAWFLLQAMRSQCYLPARIAGQCTVMETLLSTDTVEIGHKVAERVARVLESSPQARVSTYKLVKDAYTLRSSHVHGGAPKTPDETLETISEDCEGVLRRLLSKAFEDQQFADALALKNPELEKWLLELALA